MGEFPARITADDFVTPPELAPWRLAEVGAGRIGGVRLTLELRDGKTQVRAIYEQIPLRVLPVNLGPAEPALVYLVNPTAGLMDGDAHGLQIDAGPGTRAVVTGQSATRIHPSLRGFCTQQWRLRVADGAVLVVLPGPAIPFAGCRLFQRMHIELAERAQLIWGDLWYAGRYARGDQSENFRFECIVQEAAIFRAGRLIYRDRFAWHGPWNEQAARWHFGGCPAAGTLFATGTFPQDRWLDIDNPRSAIFTTAAGDTCCRYVGASEATVRAVAENALRLAATMTDASAEQPWLLTGHHLARTHWFDTR